MVKRWAVGIDFGGTNIKLGLVDPTGHVVGARSVSSVGISQPRPFVDAVTRLVDELARSVGVTTRQLCGVGVGAPGPTDASRGLVHLLVNVPGWDRVPLRRRLESRLRCPCAVDNDANLFTLGEWRWGAGRRATHLIGLTLGTGVGGGVVVGGALYRGSSGTAGEFGHVLVDPKGRRCGCGARGCLEAQIGTAAILEMGQQAIRRGAQPLGRLVERTPGRRLTPALISEAAARGDRRAREVWAQVGQWLGVGLAGIVNALNPDRIVIGGGVAAAWRWFFPTAAQVVRTRPLQVSAKAVRVVRARLGNDAGIVGAAVLVWNEFGAR